MTTVQITKSTFATTFVALSLALLVTATNMSSVIALMVHP
jgi:hypothetical protein